MTADLRAIKLLALDVDGTLTDGGLHYGPQGVSQVFSAKDGNGVMKLLEAGIQVAFVSYRDFRSTRNRAADLGVELLCLGSSDKAASVRDLASHLQISTTEILFMGDDEKDLPAMKTAGISACPSDAAEPVKEFCTLKASLPGGRGAVREIADLLLEALDG